jgi:hypothetical protein
MPKPPTGIGHAIGKTIGGIGPSIGRGLVSAFGGGFTGSVGRGVGEGVAQSLSKGAKGIKQYGQVGQTVGTLGGLGGTGYLLGPALKGLYDKATGQKKPKKVVTPEEKKWREGIASKATGGIVGDFKTSDLDNFSNNQDEGWRAGLKGMKKEDYQKLVTEAIKNDDPLQVWNEAARRAKAAGKNINVSKPLYLPQTFKKNGKTYAYAIDASGTSKSQKPKFIPIEIGKGVNWGDEEE